MKILLLCLTLIFCLCGCAGEPAVNSGVTTIAAAQETTTEAAEAEVTPIVADQGEAVADAAAVEGALGYVMKLPAKAEQVSWYVDADAGVAYASFVFEGAAYCWMMGNNLPEFSGEAFPHVNRTNWMDYPYTVYWNDEGEGHTIWEDTLQKADCHLFALEGTDGEKLAELAVMLLPAA